MNEMLKEWENIVNRVAKTKIWEKKIVRGRAAIDDGKVKYN